MIHIGDTPEEVRAFAAAVAALAHGGRTADVARTVADALTQDQGTAASA